MKDEHYNRIKKKKKNGDGNIVFLELRDLSWYMSFFVFVTLFVLCLKKKNNLKTYNMKEGTSLGIVFTFK